MISYRAFQAETNGGPQRCRIRVGFIAVVTSPDQDRLKPRVSPEARLRSAEPKHVLGCAVHLKP